MTILRITRDLCNQPFLGGSRHPLGNICMSNHPELVAKKTAFEPFRAFEKGWRFMSLATNCFGAGSQSVYLMSGKSQASAVLENV